MLRAPALRLRYAEQVQRIRMLRMSPQYVRIHQGGLRRISPPVQGHRMLQFRLVARVH
jgi:hypothetical protein